jgi:hypothetical protein
MEAPGTDQKAREIETRTAVRSRMGRIHRQTMDLHLVWVWLFSRTLHRITIAIEVQSSPVQSSLS